MYHSSRTMRHWSGSDHAAASGTPQSWGLPYAVLTCPQGAGPQMWSPKRLRRVVTDAPAGAANARNRITATTRTGGTLDLLNGQGKGNVMKKLILAVAVSVAIFAPAAYGTLGPAPIGTPCGSVPTTKTGPIIPAQTPVTRP